MMRVKRFVAGSVAVLLAITACRSFSPSRPVAIAPANPSVAQNTIFSMSAQNGSGVCNWTIEDKTIVDFTGALTQGTTIAMKSFTKPGQTPVSVTCQNGSASTTVTVRP